jgi:hypothetical protein
VRFRARLRARAVCFKASIRAFYPISQGSAPPVTVKMLPPGAPAGGFENEVEARRPVTEPVQCPRLIQACLDCEPRFLCEELVSGRMPNRQRDAQRVLDFVLGDLWRHYEGRGLELVASDELYQIDTLRKQIAEIVAETPWDPSWMERSAFLQGLEELTREKKRLVPCCLGHGDLSEGNLLIGEDDSIYLVDWERFRRLPLLRELKKIVVQYPDTWQPIVERIHRRFADRVSELMAPRSQAILIALRRIVELQAPLPGSGTPDPKRREFLRRKRSRLLRQELSAASRLVRSGAG